MNSNNRQIPLDPESRITQLHEAVEHMLPYAVEDSVRPGRQVVQFETSRQIEDRESDYLIADALRNVVPVTECTVEDVSNANTFGELFELLSRHLVELFPLLNSLRLHQTTESAVQEFVVHTIEPDPINGGVVSEDDTIQINECEFETKTLTIHTDNEYTHTLSTQTPLPSVALYMLHKKREQRIYDAIGSEIRARNNYDDVLDMYDTIRGNNYEPDTVVIGTDTVNGVNMWKGDNNLHGAEIVYSPIVAPNEVILFDESMLGMEVVSNNSSVISDVKQHRRYGNTVEFEMNWAFDIPDSGAIALADGMISDVERYI